MPRLATQVTTKTRARATFLPVASASLSGTITSAAESDIVSGGKTLILTTSGDTWVAAGGTFDAQRQAIINGIAGDDSNQLKNGLQVGDVVRTSATQVTITCSAIVSFDISTTASYSVVIPAAALVGGVAIAVLGGFSITAAAGFSSPNILDTSIESGWSGLAYNFQVPSAAVCNVDRVQNEQASNGTWSAKRVFASSGTDVGGGIEYPFYDDLPGYPSGSYTNQAAARIWTRFDFYLTSAFTGASNIQKLALFYRSGDDDFGGWYLSQGYLGWAFGDQLVLSGGTTCQLVSLSGNGPNGNPMVGAWHTCEVDYWRTGDTSNGGHDYPSVRLWLDNSEITSNGGSNPGGATGAIVNGRYNAGTRWSVYQAGGGIGKCSFMGLVNGGNTQTPTEYMDRFAISSLGRIGP